MSDDIVIKVDHVYKDFILPQEKVTSVKGLFTSLPKRHRKEKTKQHALRDISFEIKRGEFFGIVGRNGSGKSTLLKILAGIYQPTRGGVQTIGKLVPFIELGVGFNQELTGRENVYLNGAMLGFSEKQVTAMYDDIVSFAELEDFMDQKLKNYSSGMQVRLAFSMATRSQADILLIDEVLAVGDSDFQRKCYDYFKSLKRDKKTVVFVSHDMSAVREFCDRAALIEMSELKAVGLPGEIGDRYDRLFMEDTLQQNGELSKRWGDGPLKIQDFKLSKSTLTDKDPGLRIEIQLTASKKLESIMTGFRINNAAGQCLHETNTWNEKIKLPPPPADGVRTIVWECPNIYVDGKYSIDIYAYIGATPSDMWNEAARFQVKKPLYKGFLVVPTVTVTVDPAS